MNMHDRPLNKVLLSKDSAELWVFPAVIFFPRRVLIQIISYFSIHPTDTNWGCPVLQMIIIRICK